MSRQAKHYDYDAQIKRLTREPEQIVNEWANSYGLFEFCADRHLVSNAGCLTMVRKGDYSAATPELTKRIRADKRLPKNAKDITLKHLPVFKEWQEELDRTIRAGAAS